MQLTGNIARTWTATRIDGTEPVVDRYTDGFAQDCRAPVRPDLGHSAHCGRDLRPWAADVDGFIVMM
jgi:hypothetical protein